MSSNSINNSGNGNVFHQNIGIQTPKYIDELFDISDLAQEWDHRRRNRNDAFRSRIKSSALELVIGVLLLVICFIIIAFSGGFNSTSSFLSFLSDLSVSLIATILAFMSGAVLSLLGGDGFRTPSDDEVRNKEVMKQVESRVSDLRIPKKQWKTAKEKFRNNKY